MKRFLSLIIISVTLFGLSPVTFAAQIQVGNECCARAYKVYGDEQPVPGIDADGDETCQITVEIDPIISDDDKAEAQETSTPSGLGGAGESLASPFTALFEGLGLKQDLINLVNKVFKGHTEKYHQFLDEEIFGPAIAKVSEFENSKDLADFLQDKQGECDQENPLPRCVVERALCSYEKYSGVLFEQSGQQLLDSTSATQDISTMLAVLQNRDQALYQEAVQSEQALDTAMAVYSQFVDTYRLHLKFKELIAALVKVRNVTSFLHQLVGCIPNKFVGVATTKCN